MLHFCTKTKNLCCKEMFIINKPAYQIGRPSDLSESCVVYCVMKCDETQVVYSPRCMLLST